MQFAATSEATWHDEPDAVTSFPHLQERWRLQASGGVPGPEDQFDWAELCLAEGLQAPARLLFETAFIRQGFSPQLLAEQDRVATRTGLWPRGLAKGTGSPARAGTVEIAIAELRTFAKTISRPVARGIAGRQPRHETEAVPHASSISRQVSTEAGFDDFGEALHSLFLSLRGGRPLHDLGTAEALIASLRGACLRPARFDHRAFSAAPLSVLAAAVGFACIRDFLLVHRDLLLDPLGSAEVLHRAACFNSAGLGPYFTNVGRLVRKSRDVFELSYVAANAAEEAGIEIGPEPWLALLSRCLSGPLLFEVIDDLGDAGAMSALSLIYDRAANLPDDRIDRQLIMRVRDTALDNLDYDLASRAQALVVRLDPGSLLEREILGTIDGSAGRIVAAEQSFAACLVLAPGHEEVVKRLIALRAHKFDPFVVRQGYGIPEDRRIVRMRRHTAADKTGKMLTRDELQNTARKFCQL
jgi:hypothetical protein